MTRPLRQARRLRYLALVGFISFLGATTMTHASPSADHQAVDAVALSGDWGDYKHGVSVANGLFRVIYRGGVPDIEKLTPYTQGTGAGVLEGPLTAPDPRWDQARKVICEGTDFGGMNPGNSMGWGSARCASGEIKSASADPIVGGRDAKMLTYLFGNLLLSYYREGMSAQGSRQVWLEAETYVAPAGDKLNVTLRLINSGKEDLVLESPEQWEGIRNPMGEGSTYVAVGADGDTGHEFGLPRLGGTSLASGQSFPDGRLIVPAGQHRDVMFLSYTEKPFPAGNYTTRGSVNSLHVLAPASLKGSVQMWFRQTSGNRFEHNYPTNDADLSRLEAARRQREAALPALTVGSKVTEGGWYRAVGDRSSQGEPRSDVPRLFYTGDTLPAEPLVHVAADGSHDAGIATGWRWEAYLEAQLTGHPRERCPRSGLWLPTLPADAPAYLSVHVQPKRMEAGQPMLTMGLPDAAMESRVVWTWIGDGEPTMPR